MDRSQMMAAVRSKDTQPEMIVRRLVHSMGYRYRLHAPRLPGKPDLVFAKRRKVIFVHGCFWHQHGGCKGSHLPKSNRGYWLPKLERNRTRDAEHLKALRADGWRCLVLWECELCRGAALRRRISRFLN
jgi:DNA mismatch endonuclease (patch repair protein)